MTGENRISRRFQALAEEGRGGLVAFVTAGDPDRDTSAEILAGLPAAGADFIELGVPFSDPMADGPAIQAGSLRALKSGANLKKTLDMVTEFRAHEGDTPIVLMGYFNPIYVHGVEDFVGEASKAGIDGLIIVDLPVEEADELAVPARQAGIDIIALAAPTSDDARLRRVLADASGFVYYVSVTGTTGTASAAIDDIAAAVARLRGFTPLPIAVGFGIRTPEQAAAVAAVADAAVVGSALVNKVAENLDGEGRARPGLAGAVLDAVAALAEGVRGARPSEAAQ